VGKGKHRFRIRLIASTFFVASALLGQEPTVKEKQEAGPEAEHEEPRIEGEFVASDLFRDGTAIIKIWRGLHLEGEYFGGANYDIGGAGAAWKFRWKGLSISPGLGVAFGSAAQTAPIVTFRWTLDTRRVFSQGFFAQSLRAYVFVEEAEPSHETGETPVSEQLKVHTSILDNNHVSLRLGPVEVGPMWERIRYREENEWKGGLRVAARLRKGVKIIFQTVGPEVEYRGGIAFER
jgi:hypothetical protein